MNAIKINPNTIVINPGREVVCDACCKDYTNSTLQGGVLDLNWAYCPECASVGKFSKRAKHCPPGKAFADWVRQDLR